MLTELRVRDYKSFGSPVTLPLRRITVLFGKNNSGKTAATRLPLLILAALSGHSAALTGPLPLRVRGLHYASSMLELVHGQVPHGSFGLGATFSEPEQRSREIDFEVQLRQSLSAGQSAFVAAFQAFPDIERITWTQEPLDGAVEYGDKNIVGFDGVLPRFSDRRRQPINELRRRAERQLGSLIHLTSIRHPLDSIYETRPPEGFLNPDGEEAPYLLNADQDLLKAVSNWYATELGLEGITIDAAGSGFRLTMGAPRGFGHNLARAGQGIQQVLPVATYLLAFARPVAQPELFVVEEPELHLHPSAHGALSDLFITASSACPSLQLLVETHSENFLLRLRRRVADGTLAPEDLNFLWFEEVNGQTQVREIEIQHDGSVTHWPKGVFAEDLAEVRAIVRAAQE